MTALKLSRKAFLRAVGGIAIGGSVAACAAPAAPAPTAAPAAAEATVAPEAPKETAATVMVWAWPGFVDPIRDLVPKFNEKNPDIKIEFQQMAWADVHTKLITALAAGTGAPDIAGVSDYKIGDMAGVGGGLADLTDWMKPYEKDFVPVHWNELVKDGKIWAVPSDAAPVVVYYRKDLFDQWNLDLEKATLWDEFISIGQQVTEKSGGKSNLMGLQTGVVGIHQDLTGQLGGAVFSVEGKTIVNDQKNLDALKLIKKLVDSGVAVKDVTAAAWNASMKDGSLACYIQPAWFVFPMKEQAPETSGAWRVMKMPAFAAGGSRASDDGGANLAITEQSKVKEAAFTYLAFTQCTKEGQLQQFTKFDLFPTFKPALDDPAFDEPVDFFGKQAMRRILADVAVEAPAIWRGSNYMEARDILNQELVAAVAGEKTPEQALVDAETAIKSKVSGS
jgi:lactose/L-arabinose transport system substrate-binding protein